MRARPLEPKTLDFKTSDPHAIDIAECTFLKEIVIAKNQNTYAKRQREMEKKAKAEAKRARRLKEKQAEESGDGTPVEPKEEVGVELSDLISDFND